MNKESILVGVASLLAGIVITGFAAGQAVNNSNTGVMRMMGMDTNMMQQQDVTDHGSMSMANMTQQLQNKSGDDFDKAFIEMMIAHHDGAVDMAEQANSRAKHNEVKQLSKAIITAQKKEISDMEQWQKNWGYSADEMMDMMHGNN